MPNRKDFQLSELAQWIPNLILIDAQTKQGKPSFTYRLVGSALEAMAQKSLSKTDMQSIAPSEEPGSLYEAYKTCWMTCRPNYQYMQIKHPSGTFGTFERIVLPMEPSSDGKPSMLCGIVLFNDMWRDKFLGSKK
jgi:hypothetical protein